MGYAERIADETAHHYAELRQRRVPLLLAMLMAARFHEFLTRTIVLDDQFAPTVTAILEPSIADEDAD